MTYVWCAVHVSYSLCAQVSTGGIRMDFRSTFILTLLVKMLRMGLNAAGGRKRRGEEEERGGRGGGRKRRGEEEEGRRMLTQCTNRAYQC